MQELQKVNPFKPLVSTVISPAPVTLHMLVTPNTDSFVGGVPQSAAKVEVYVLLSALPREMQERIKLALQAIATAG